MGIAEMEKVILAETPLIRTAVDFDALVHVYARFVYKVAFALLRNSEDAEDVVQETFFRAYRSGEAGNVERMRAWLARIAWRLAVDRIRRRPRLQQSTESEAILRQVPANHPSAEESFLLAERTAILDRLLRGLPRDFREPLLLSTVDGMTSAEISEVLGILESAVRTRLSRGRKVLKQKLAALMEGSYES
jgi:RNA polymerase sigma-70 factor, ECF subfamily